MPQEAGQTIDTSEQTIDVPVDEWDRAKAATEANGETIDSVIQAAPRALRR